jgi:hypothetical protein
MLQKDKPNIAFRRFYEWTEKTGHSSKLYSTGSEGQLVLKA